MPQRPPWLNQDGPRLAQCLPRLAQRPLRLPQPGPRLAHAPPRLIQPPPPERFTQEVLASASLSEPTSAPPVRAPPMMTMDHFLRLRRKPLRSICFSSWLSLSSPCCFLRSSSIPNLHSPLNEPGPGVGDRLLPPFRKRANPYPFDAGLHRFSWVVRGFAVARHPTWKSASSQIAIRHLPSRACRRY